MLGSVSDPLIIVVIKGWMMLKSMLPQVGGENISMCMNFLLWLMVHLQLSILEKPAVSLRQQSFLLLFLTDTEHILKI